MRGGLIDLYGELYNNLSGLKGGKWMRFRSEDLARPLLDLDLLFGDLDLDGGLNSSAFDLLLRDGTRNLDLDLLNFDLLSNLVYLYLYVLLALGRRDFDLLLYLVTRDVYLLSSFHVRLAFLSNGFLLNSFNFLLAPYGVNIYLNSFSYLALTFLLGIMNDVYLDLLNVYASLRLDLLGYGLNVLLNGLLLDLGTCYIKLLLDLYYDCKSVPLDIYLNGLDILSGLLSVISARIFGNAINVLRILGIRICGLSARLFRIKGGILNGLSHGTLSILGRFLRSCETSSFARVALGRLDCGRGRFFATRVRRNFEHLLGGLKITKGLSINGAICNCISRFINECDLENFGIGLRGTRKGLVRANGR